MLILASQSPRRKELLEQQGLTFKIMPSAIDESLIDGMSPTDYVLHLAKTKANHIFNQQPDDLVLGADTIVLLGNEILGKPEDASHAFEMLKKLVGQRHYVYTAVSLIDRTKEVSWLSYAEVVFKHVSDEQLWSYIETKEPMDKAGGYAIQGLGSFLVQSYYGNYHAIVGLPIDEVMERLKAFNPRHLLKTKPDV